MGTSSILDIIGSVFVFGLLFLMVIRLNQSASENSAAYAADYMLQRNMATLTVMLEQDLKRVGLNSNATATGIPPILVAQPNRFQFLTDTSGSTVPGAVAADIVEWRVGNPSEIPETENPFDCYLYRTVNGVTTRMNLGVTDFRFKYYSIMNSTDSLLFPIVTLGNIGPIDVTIRLQSPFKANQEYMDDASHYVMLWRQIRSVSRNSTLQTSAR
jgi:hypothetical protein